MRADGWKQLILDAARNVEAGNNKTIDLLAKYLELVDDAKQELRNRGYGWTGLDILETIKLVPFDV